MREPSSSGRTPGTLTAAAKTALVTISRAINLFGGCRAADFQLKRRVPPGDACEGVRSSHTRDDGLVSEQREHLEADLQAAFGDAYPRLATFAAMLSEEGVTRGLIGPREVPRIWERHILNSSAVAPFLPAEGTVVDVGSGAGFPGIVLACMRPDLPIVLLEPMDRRVTWLREVAVALELTSTEVVRGRAEDVHGTLSATVATARAVAPMDRLARWLLPLLHPGGVLLAMKGDRAPDEVTAARTTITHLGGGDPQILRAPTVTGAEATTIVRIEKIREPSVPTRRRPVQRR